MRHWGKSLVLPIILLAGFVFPGCRSQAREWPYGVEFGAAKLNVEVALTDKERQRGLMFRDELEDGWGMIFVWDAEQVLSFWMKNTKVPLSVAFIDKDLVVRDIQDMQPETLNPHASKVPAMYALEARQGWFAAHGVKVGTPVKFSKGLIDYLVEGRGKRKP